MCQYSIDTFLLSRYVQIPTNAQMFEGRKLMEEGKWIKLARNFVGMTARELAEKVGVSMNYIQRIEKGDRRMSSDVQERVFQAVGFNQELIDFDSSPLLKKINELIDSHSKSQWCTLDSVMVKGRRYYTDCHCIVDPMTTDNPPDNILRLSYAKTEVETQIILHEGTPLFLSDK